MDFAQGQRTRAEAIKTARQITRRRLAAIAADDAA